MAELIWTEKAVEQIEEIGSFIEKDSPFQARRVVQLITKETRKLTNTNNESAAPRSVVTQNKKRVKSRGKKWKGVISAFSLGFSDRLSNPPLFQQHNT